MLNKKTPFLRKKLGNKYHQTSFDDLKISTATLDVRCAKDANINFITFFEEVPCLTAEECDQFADLHLPPGTIVAIGNGDKTRGKPPTKSSNAFKNSNTIWIWLREKTISVKISASSFHMTGCKAIEQAAEGARYIQQHLELLHEVKGIKMYDNYPYVIEIRVCMINFNFDLKVALDLTQLANFIIMQYRDLIWTSYDPNLFNCMMLVKFSKMKMSYTIHDNGRISMCTNEPNIELAMENVMNGYRTLYLILETFQASIEID
ncbi:MAG: hypothetical protein ACMG6E_06610 [Candidatus Roizmanbacteria bacterium]